MSIQVHCEICKHINEKPWDFTIDVKWYTEGCTKCSDKYNIRIPDQGNVVILTNAKELQKVDEIECNMDKYLCFYCADFTQFGMSWTRKQDLVYPVMIVTKNMNFKNEDGKRFEYTERGLVELREIEEYISN